MDEMLEFFHRHTHQLDEEAFLRISYYRRQKAYGMHMCSCTCCLCLASLVCIPAKPDRPQVSEKDVPRRAEYLQCLCHSPRLTTGFDASIV